MRKTSEVAKILDQPYYTIFNLVRGGHVRPPVKDGSGDYLWSEADIQQARQVINHRRARKQQKETTTCASK